MSPLQGQLIPGSLPYRMRAWFRDAKNEGAELTYGQAAELFDCSAQNLSMAVGRLSDLGELEFSRVIRLRKGQP